MPYTQEEKAATIKYDYAMFHCLLKYVYKIKDLNDIETLDVNKYIKTLEPLYNQSFLNEDKKSKKVQKNFCDIKADVFFFQEYSQSFFDAVKETKLYHLANDDNKDTLIIVKKSSFKTDRPLSTEVFKKNHIS